MNKLFALMITAVLALGLTACGAKVEVPPASIGKIMTKDGYQKGVIGTSKFRLAPCMAYCDKIVLLSVADQANTEALEIFLPEDKLKLKVSIRTNLSISTVKAESLFNTMPPSAEINERTSSIDRSTIYKTYAQQIIMTETREYLSQFSIAEIASSMEKVNNDLRLRLQKSLEARTPFSVRYVGITNIEYPSIITEAQENAARRREEIQQEEAKLQVSQVQLQREFQEAQLQRKIDVEKAEADAEADRVRAVAASNPAVITLRKLEIEKIKASRWNGVLPRVQSDGKTSFLIDERGDK